MKPIEFLISLAIALATALLFLGVAHAKPTVVAKVKTTVVRAAHRPLAALAKDACAGARGAGDEVEQASRARDALQLILGNTAEVGIGLSASNERVLKVRATADVLLEPVPAVCRGFKVESKNTAKKIVVPPPEAPKPVPNP